MPFRYLTIIPTISKKQNAKVPSRPDPEAKDIPNRKPRMGKDDLGEFFGRVRLLDGVQKHRSRAAHGFVAAIDNGMNGNSRAPAVTVQRTGKSYRNARSHTSPESRPKIQRTA